MIEDVIPVTISLEPPCKGCRLGFIREKYEGGNYPFSVEG